LKYFQWCLQNVSESRDGFKPIKKSRLEKADRLDTVDLMVQMYNTKTAEVTEKILKKIKRIEVFSLNSVHLPIQLITSSLLNPAGRCYSGPVLSDWKTGIVSINHFVFQNYPVTEQSRLNRVALVINNQRFDDHKDEHNMLDLLQNLQYEVVKYNRLTAQEIGDALIKFSSHPKLPLTDSVFVVIMSNGDSRVLFGIDHEEFKIDHIYEHLNTKNCPALLNKPKVIIIQSCNRRGSTDIKQAKSSVLVKDPLVHKERDFISIVSCTPHTVYRSPRYGSSFIQDIVEVFNTFSQDEHIEVLFKKVSLTCGWIWFLWGGQGGGKKKKKALFLLKFITGMVWVPANRCS
uniref:Caspase family p20 domain-containing protein n=1 Tax=Amphilophus citrinellus TaxID=61819 RepID=A0A3Q0QX50_AMPCI